MTTNNVEKMAICGIENVPSTFGLMFNQAKDFTDEEGNHPLFEKVDKVSEYNSLKARAMHETLAKSDYNKLHSGFTNTGSAAGIIKSLWAMGKETFEKQTTFSPKKGEKNIGAQPYLEYSTSVKSLLLSSFALGEIRSMLKVGQTAKCTLQFEWIEYLNDKRKKVVTTAAALGTDRILEMACEEESRVVDKLTDDEKAAMISEWTRKHTFGKVVSTNDDDIVESMESPLCTFTYLKKARQFEYCYEPFAVLDILRKWAKGGYLETIAKAIADEKAAKAAKSSK